MNYVFHRSSIIIGIGPVVNMSNRGVIAAIRFCINYAVLKNRNCVIAMPRLIDINAIKRIDIARIVRKAKLTVIIHI